MSDDVVRKRGRPPKKKEDDDFVQPDFVQQPPTTKDDDIRKPTHDARMQYYEALKFVLLTKYYASMQGDLRSYYRALRVFHLTIVAYVQQDKLRGVSALFARAETLLNTSASYANVRSPTVRTGVMMSITELEKVLYMIDELLHKAGKDMMLPTGGSEGTELDLDDVLRRSGL